MISSIQVPVNRTALHFNPGFPHGLTEPVQKCVFTQRDALRTQSQHRKNSVAHDFLREWFYTLGFLYTSYSVS